MIDISILIAMLTPFLGIIAYFFKRIVDKLDQFAERSISLEKQVGIITSNLSDMKVDIERALLVGEQNSKLANDVEILRRDLKTCFAKLDELQFSLRKVR